MRDTALTVFNQVYPPFLSTCFAYCLPYSRYYTFISSEKLFHLKRKKQPQLSRVIVLKPLVCEYFIIGFNSTMLRQQSAYRDVIPERVDV